MDEFVVTGTRPSSAMSSQRSSSSGRKHHGYHIIAKPSYVDESLFGSQHNARLDEQLKSFKAPWEYPKPATPRNTFAPAPKIKSPLKPERKGRPLFWSPSPSETTNTRVKARVTTPSGSQTSTSKAASDYLWNTRDHFRRLKHTPTYVDESLFGPRLQEPDFKAPWNERKKGEKKPIRPYLFDPSGGGGVAGSGQEDVSQSKPRPATALGISRESKRKRRASGGAPPVWKP